MTGARLARIAWLFAPLVVVLAYLYPPLIAPDDDEHFARAYITAHGEWIVTQPGGYVDTGLSEVFKGEFWHARDPVKYRVGAPETEWSGRLAYRHSVAAYYLPILYAPQVVAIWAGEGLGWSIQDTARLARVLNGLTALGLLSVALGQLPAGFGALVLVLMALPRTLLHFASNSADGLLLACAAGVLALTLRALAGERLGWPLWLLAGLAVVAMGGVRPPLVMFGAVTGWAALRRRDWPGLAVSAAAVVTVAGWWGWVMPRFTDDRCGSLSPVSFLLGDPAGVLARTFEAHGLYYLLSFIGEIGWGSGPDGLLTPLPLVLYALGIVALGIGAARCLGSDDPQIRTLDRLALTGAGGALALGIMVALAVACTKDGSDVIRGVQGRYFVQPLLLIAAGLAGAAPASDVLGRAVWWVWLALFVVSSATLIANAVALYG